MRLKTVSVIMLTLSLIGMLTFIFNIQDAKADDSWIWVTDTVTGAYGEAVVGTGDALYIARKTSFYRYNPLDNSWTTLAAPPNPDSGDAFKTGTALAWDSSDYIYAFYGAATPDSRRWFYRYNISSNSWEALANTTANQGEGNAIAWVGVNNCIYATIGGEQRPTYFVRYDPSTNSWSNAPANPPAGMGDGASLVWTGGNLLYALRGEFSESSPLYDFWRYNLTDDTWTAMANVPADPQEGGKGGVGDGGSVLYVGLWLPDHDDYIYALGGNQVDEVPDNRTYRYTVSLNSWERLADLPFEVGYYVGCRLGYANGNIYAWQGAPSTWTGGGDDLARCELLIDSTPPTILILSPENKTHTLSDVPLTFTVNESTSWISYSLNGQSNATITGNTTVPTLPDGGHSVVVYANDTYGNMGISDIMLFTVDVPAVEELSFDVTVGESVYVVCTCSNSSVSDLTFNQALKRLRFSVNGTSGTTGFCNVTVPAELMSGNFSLYIDDVPLVKDVDYAEVYNGTHNLFSISYEHSSHIVEIISTIVIPDFAGWFFLPFVMLATLLALIIRKGFRKPK